MKDNTLPSSLICGERYINLCDGDAYELVARGVNGGCALKDVDGSILYVPESCIDLTQNALVADAIWNNKLPK